MNEEKTKEPVPVWARVLLFFTGVFFLVIGAIVFAIFKEWWALICIAVFSGIFFHQAFSKNKKWIYEGIQAVFEMVAYACLGIVKLFQ